MFVLADRSSEREKLKFSTAIYATNSRSCIFLVYYEMRRKLAPEYSAFASWHNGGRLYKHLRLAGRGFASVSVF